MNKAIKYRLYPTRKQTEYFLKCFGCCRFVYNQALNWRMAAYKADGTSLNYNDTAFGLTALKHQFKWLKEADSIALQQALRNLDTAYSSFLRKNDGFPKFKSAKHSRKSYSTINQNGTVAILDGLVKLPKVGTVKAKIHRQPLSDWKLKSATVSMDSDGRFYVSCLFEFDKPICVVPISGKAIGLDYKSNGLYMDSNGNIGSNHKYYRESHDKLARAQRKLRHKTSGSNNYRKQQLKINRIHKHIANQRLDHLHKLSTEIANQYDVVCVESLNMRSMSNKGFGNGKATLDNGYGMFLSMLEYKLSDRGKHFVKVDKWFPSTQLCSHCGGRLKLTLNQHIYKCSCGLTIDRDLNAAINIRNEGLRILRSA
ncbi:MAG: transposase [Lachnospiraceae bacterium]|nr:transposase [Lachnospiraceae bacterium]